MHCTKIDPYTIRGLTELKDDERTGIGQQGQMAVVADLVGTDHKDRKEMTDLNTDWKSDRVRDDEYDRNLRMKYRNDMKNHNESEV